MSKITVKSTKSVILAAYEDAIRELELVKRQLAETTTEKGILLSQLEERNQQVKLLNDEVELLKESYDEIESQLVAAEAQIKRQGQVIAASPKSAPPASPKKPAPKPSVPVSAIEAQPVVQITDADRRVWSAFNALPREKRQAYYEFARATVGHLGIHNIVSVREAYLAQQAA